MMGDEMGTHTSDAQTARRGGLLGTMSSTFSECKQVRLPSGTGRSNWRSEVCWVAWSAAAKDIADRRVDELTEAGIKRRWRGRAHEVHLLKCANAEATRVTSHTAVNAGPLQRSMEVPS